MTNHVIWCEKYRPQTVKECILPTKLKGIFQGIVDSKEVPNLLLSGGPGMGKTTVAKAICNELDIDYLMINASDERNIDVLRTSIKQFASSLSFGGKRKIVILDEADNLNPTSTQPALRSFMEEFASNCGFILTCNQKNKLIPALHSRMAVKDFTIPKEDKKEIYKDLFTRLKYILEQEKVTYDPKVLVELIQVFFPDYRRLINEMQAFSKDNGRIDSGILGFTAELDTARLFKSLKEKDFPSIREWVVDNLNNDASRIYRKIYDSLKLYLKPTSIPDAIVLLADYQYRSNFSVDQEICLVAFMVEVLKQCEFA